MNAVEVLEGAKKVLVEYGWAKGDHAVLKNEDYVDGFLLWARADIQRAKKLKCSFCLEGALIVAADDPNLDEMEAFKTLSAMCENTYDSPINEVNDVLLHTQDEALDLLDRAIDLAKDNHDG